VQKVQKLFSAQRSKEVHESVATVLAQDVSSLPSWLLPLLGTFVAGCCCILAAGSLSSLLSATKRSQTTTEYQLVGGDEEEDIHLSDEENVLYASEDTRLLAGAE